MRVTLIGGMDRLARHYLKAAQEVGVDLRIFNRPEAGLAQRIHGSQAVVLFTGKVSHQARDLAMGIAKAHAIPVYQYHSCGVCTLRKCLSCLGGTGMAARS
ncbi:MAG: DUF2325 domain-containing protein [Verrucomicrobiota bacterium]